MYFRHAWAGFDCVARALMVDKEGGDSFVLKCVERMAQYIETNPALILDQLASLGMPTSEALKQFAMDTAKCDRE